MVRMPDKSVSDDDKKESLIAQYKETQANQRELLTLFWQQPSITIVIASGLVVAAYYYISQDLCDKHIEYQFLRPFSSPLGPLCLIVRSSRPSSTDSSEQYG